jgi:hypothetical protein
MTDEIKKVEKTLSAIEQSIKYLDEANDIYYELLHEFRVDLRNVKFPIVFHLFQRIFQKAADAANKKRNEPVILIAKPIYDILNFFYRYKSTAELLVKWCLTRNIVNTEEDAKHKFWNFPQLNKCYLQDYVDPLSTYLSWISEKPTFPSGVPVPAEITEFQEMLGKLSKCVPPSIMVKESFDVAGKRLKAKYLKEKWNSNYPKKVYDESRKPKFEKKKYVKKVYKKSQRKHKVVDADGWVTEVRPGHEPVPVKLEIEGNVGFMPDGTAVNISYDINAPEKEKIKIPTPVESETESEKEDGIPDIEDTPIPTGEAKPDVE